MEYTNTNKPSFVKYCTQLQKINVSTLEKRKIKYIKQFLFIPILRTNNIRYIIMFFSLFSLRNI